MRIAEVTGWTGQVVAVADALTPDHLQLPFDFAHHWWADSRRIRKELGYSERVPPKEALRRATDWERANPPAKAVDALFNYEPEDAALTSALCDRNTGQKRRSPRILSVCVATAAFADGFREHMSNGSSERLRRVTKSAHTFLVQYG